MRGVGIAAAIAVGATVLSLALLALWQIAAAALARRAADSEDVTLLDTAALVELLFVAAYVVTWIIAVVLVIVWLYRARANLDALGVAATGPRRGWAIGGWFVPFANLVIPFRVMAAVVRGSLSHAGSTASLLLWSWWLTWLSFLSLDRIMSQLDTAYDDLPATVLTQDDFQAYVGYYEDQLLRYVLGTILCAVAGTLLIVLILRVSRGQDERLTTTPSAPIMPGAAVPELTAPHQA